MNIFKKAFVTIIGLTLFPTFTVFAFSDVNDSHQYSEAINFLSNEGIVSGYPDGSYKPENSINRAELLKIVIEAVYDSNIEEYGSRNCFSDVPSNDWYTKYICFAQEKGIVEGYRDGTFRPNDTVSFVEALKIALFGFGENHSAGDPWYMPLYSDAGTRGLIPSDVYSPTAYLNRGQMAELIKNILKEDGDDTNGTTGNTSNTSNVVTSSDDIYTLKAGDWVHLSNNLDIEIVDLSQSSIWEAKIRANHYINGEKLSPTPYYHGLSLVGENWNEAFGYRIEIIAVTDSHDQITASIKPLTQYLSKPQDLYDACMDSGVQDQANCLTYSLHWVVDGYEKFESDNVIIFAPKKYPKTSAYYVDQFEACYTSLNENFGLSRYSDEKILVQLTEGADSGVAEADRIYLKASYSGNDEGFAPTGECNQSDIAHELAHFLIRPAALSNPLNEGFATYIEYESQKDFMVDGDLFQHADYTCYDSYLHLETNLGNESYDINYVYMEDFSYSNLRGHSYLSSACFWEKLMETENLSMKNDIIPVILKYRGEKHGGIEYQLSILEKFSEELGIDADYLREKWKFDLDSEYGFPALSRSGVTF